jgi:hypothetical protein
MLVEFVTKANSTLSSTPEFANLTRSATGPVVETAGGVGAAEGFGLTGAAAGSGSVTWTGDSAVGCDKSAGSVLVEAMVLVAGESASVAEAAREHPPANGRSPKANARLQLQRNWFFIGGPDRSSFMHLLSRGFDCIDSRNIHSQEKSQSFMDSGQTPRVSPGPNPDFSLLKASGFEATM